MKNFNFLWIGVLLVIAAGLFFFFGNFIGITGIVIVELIILAAIIFLLVRYFKERDRRNR